MFPVISGCGSFSNQVFFLPQQLPAGSQEQRLFFKTHAFFLIPERCGQLEGSDSRGGKAQGVSVGDLLHRTVEALNVVPLQH